MKQFKKSMILLALASFAFGSVSFAECHLGSDGNQYCGDHCAFNSDGTWSCYNDSTPYPYDPRPVECHLGSNGQQYCGHECALNSDGTWSCD
jgi:hypothetical protein